MKVDVSIIIVNYNSIKLLTNCIKSIIQFTKDVTYEIIVVDNDSKDDLSLLKEDQSFSLIDLKFFKLNKNLGFGRANNEGAKYAKGEYLFLLNPDTILLNDAISILVDFMNKNKEVGACGGNLYNMEIQPTRSFRRKLPDNTWLLDHLLFGNKLELLFFGNDCYFNTSDKPLKVAYIVGADLMIRKEIFDNLKGFDPDFFMYYEEIELCSRIKKSGYNIMNCPGAKIQHLEGKTMSNVEFKSNQMYKSLKLYFKKTSSFLTYRISRLIYFCLSIQRYLVFLLMGKDKNRKYWRIQLINFFKEF